MPASPLSAVRPEKVLSRLAVVSALSTATIGLLVLLGWHLGIPALLRLHPTFVAMQYTTALGFTFGAAAVLAALWKASRTAIAFASIVTLLALTAALRYLGFDAPSFDEILWHFGVDPALRYLTVIKTSSPGRMAPNTALGFLLVAAAIVSLVLFPRSRRAADASTLAAVATAGFAFLALLGYLGGAPSTYGWGGLTRMAVHTAIAMLALGVAVCAVAALRIQALGAVILDRLPVFIATGGAVVSFGLWLAAADQEHQELEQAVQVTAVHVRDGIASQLQPGLLALSRMRQRWEFSESGTKRSLENDAKTNLLHFPGFRGIAWLDAGLRPVWIVANDDEDTAQLEPLLSPSRLRAEGRFLKRYGSAFGRSAVARTRFDRHRGALDIAEWSDSVTGRRSLIALLPLRPRGHDDGYLLGVFSIKRLVELALVEQRGAGYAVRLYSGDQLFYDNAPHLARGRLPTSRQTLQQSGISWVVEVTPSPEVLAAHASRLPLIVAFVGLLVTVLLTVLLRVVQVSRRRELAHLAAMERAKDAEVAYDRAAELADVNEQLMEQSAERERAQRERESMQQQLAQAQKMEAVGQLAGGVAHDFNNLLTVITSYCELLLEDIPAEDARRADVEEVMRASASAARLTRQLLAFSRQQILQPQPVDLNGTVVEIEKMLRRLLPADISLRTTLQPNLGITFADRGQLEQIIVNLVVNARDAMPNGGTATIETSNVDLDETYVSRRPFAAPEPGRYVVLTVSDTGHGMDEATQQRVFEPFFTTKEKGRGTGLGLSTVYGIVKQSGGYVWLYSEVGRGTSFKIYLPRVEAESGRRLGVPDRQDVRGGQETILLVEDDAAVRTIAQRVLERHGYVVLAASHGADALRLSAEWSQSLDLVVTDIVMPEMNGPEMLEQLQVARPGIRVLMVSGYTSDQSFRQRVIDEGIPFLEKPFTPNSLLAKIRDVLDAEPVAL